MLQGNRRIGKFVEFHARKLFEGQLQGKVVYRGVEGEGNMYVRLGRVAGRQAGKQASKQAWKTSIVSEHAYQISLSAPKLDKIMVRPNLAKYSLNCKVTRQVFIFFLL